ncbi:MAG TPA: hypothetical protein PLF27_01085 [Sedimentibacter sp.]|jgi:tRNA-dihydrouridine synthase|nr:hypothetical protein [Sedimentibacter sp.]
MIWVKSALFTGTVITVRYIFSLINSDGDQKIDKMKEMIDFTEYLRVYSCDMKMSFEEIYQKYSFKSSETKKLVKLMHEFLKEKRSSQELLVNINKFMLTPDPFNMYFAEIIDYYGSAYSDLLNKKLNLALEEMKKSLDEYAARHNEIKALNNRISFLAGCLAAIIIV